jgi:phosphotransferase system  glucose/maltose/N-acetylglucosamine-specific IIC component
MSREQKIDAELTVRSFIGYLLLHQWICSRIVWFILSGFFFVLVLFFVFVFFFGWKRNRKEDQY